MLKILFSSLGENGVLFKHPTDFSKVRDSYTTYLDNKFAVIAKARSDFSSLPNRSAVGLASYHKIDAVIRANRIMPFTNYDDMILLINFLVKVSFMLQGGKEQANLLWSNFRSFRVTSGQSIGCRKLVSVNLQEKTVSVSVKNPTRGDNTGLEIVKCTENINTCVLY